MTEQMIEDKGRSRTICSSARTQHPKWVVLKSTCHQHATPWFVTPKTTKNQKREGKQQRRRTVSCGDARAEIRCRSDGQADRWSIRWAGQEVDQEFSAEQVRVWLCMQRCRTSDRCGDAHARSSASWARWCSIQYKITCPKESET